TPLRRYFAIPRAGEISRRAAAPARATSIGVSSAPRTRTSFPAPRPAAARVDSVAGAYTADKNAGTSTEYSGISNRTSYQMPPMRYIGTYTRASQPRRLTNTGARL